MSNSTLLPEFLQGVLKSCLEVVGRGRQQRLPARDRILDVLDESGVTDWEALLSAVTDDFEARLEEALRELQSEGHVRHSPREGGYTVVDDGR